MADDYVEELAGVSRRGFEDGECDQRRKRKPTGRGGTSTAKRCTRDAAKRAARKAEMAPTCFSESLKASPAQGPAPNYPSIAGQEGHGLIAPPSSARAIEGPRAHRESSPSESDAPRNLAIFPVTPEPSPNTTPGSNFTSLTPSPPYDPESPPRYRAVRVRPLIFRRHTGPAVRRDGSSSPSPVRSGRVSKRGGHEDARAILRRIRNGSQGKQEKTRMRQMRLTFGDAFSQISDKLDKLDRPIISPEQMQQIVDASTEAAIRATRAEMRAARESEDAEHQRREAAAANAPYWRRGLAIVRRYGPEVGKAIQTVDAVVRFAGRVQGARRWLSA